MSFINYPCREISCKIVYYGPGYGGKTTNVQFIHDRTVKKQRGQMISLKTEADRTLFFDFLPIDIGEIQGFTTRLKLYTVPGQVFYKATRKLILRGADGVVFVADSHVDRRDNNLESLEDLEENLAEMGMSLGAIPFVVQYNKRDLDRVESVPNLRALLNPRGAPDFEAVAHRGVGVFETLKSVSRLVLFSLKNKSAAAAHRSANAP